MQVAKPDTLLLQAVVLQILDDTFKKIKKTQEKKEGQWVVAKIPHCIF